MMDTDARGVYERLIADLDAAGMASLNNGGETVRQFIQRAALAREAQGRGGQDDWITQKAAEENGAIVSVAAQPDLASLQPAIKVNSGLLLNALATKANQFSPVISFKMFVDAFRPLIAAYEHDAAASLQLRVKELEALTAEGVHLLRGFRKVDYPSTVAWREKAEATLKPPASEGGAGT